MLILTYYDGSVRSPAHFATRFSLETAIEKINEFQIGFNKLGGRVQPIMDLRLQSVQEIPNIGNHHAKLAGLSLVEDLADDLKKMEACTP